MKCLDYSNCFMLENFQFCYRNNHTICVNNTTPYYWKESSKRKVQFLSWVESSGHCSLAFWRMWIHVAFAISLSSSKTVFVFKEIFFCCFGSVGPMDVFQNVLLRLVYPFQPMFILFPIKNKINQVKVDAKNGGILSLSLLITIIKGKWG